MFIRFFGIRLDEASFKTMNNPLVSVIIPNYNHARYLDERIQSILNQTYQNFELIILDDKSTDNSLELINKYKNNSHVSCVVINEENSGSTFKQWHKGFELAKGELIWIAESDDKCEKEFLSALVPFFERDDSCVLAYVKSVFMQDDGSYQHTELGKAPELFQGVDFIEKKMAFGNSIVNASSAIFSKAVAQRVNKRYMEYKGAGDWLFWIEIAEQGNVGIDYRELNFFRIHENNSTKRYYFEGINQREVLTILKYILEKQYISKKKFVKAKRLYARWNIYSDRLSPNQKKEICQQWGLGFIDRICIFWYDIIEVIEYKFGIKI